MKGLLWLLRLLPQKPQPSQVRDTQPEPTPEPAPSKPKGTFTPVSRTQVEQAREFLKFMDQEDRYRQAQQWAHIAIPRHKRDLDLVNRLKREGKL
jgi:hypothetical protein